MIETEVRGELTNKQFENILNSLKNSKNYSYESNKRITFCYGDYSNQKIDMRVRITNGQPVVMQKVGNWQDLSREEIEIEISKDRDSVYKIMSNIYSTIKNSFETLIQHENHLFTNEKYELKLTKQFGKSDYFIFELEAKAEGVDLKEESSALGLEVRDKFESEEDRKNRNEKVNLDPRSLAVKDMKEIITNYLSN